MGHKMSRCLRKRYSWAAFYSVTDKQAQTEGRVYLHIPLKLIVNLSEVDKVDKCEPRWLDSSHDTELLNKESYTNVSNTVVPSFIMGAKH